LWLESQKRAPDAARTVDALAALRAAQRRGVLAGWWRGVPLVFVAAAMTVGGWAWLRQVRIDATQAAQQAELIGSLRHEVGRFHERVDRSLADAARSQHALAVQIGLVGDRLATLVVEQSSQNEAMLRAGKAAADAVEAQRAMMENSARESAENRGVFERAQREIGQRHATAQLEMRERLERMTGEIAQLNARTNAPAAKPAVPPEIGDVAGTNRVQQGERLLFWFPKRLFHRGLLVKRTGADDVLKALAGALHRAKSDSLRIEVIGAAGESGLFSTPESLAYQRAASVAQRLALYSGLPSEAVVARAATRNEIADQATRGSDTFEREAILVVVMHATAGLP